MRLKASYTVEAAVIISFSFIVSVLYGRSFVHSAYSSCFDAVCVLYGVLVT